MQWYKFVLYISTNGSERENEYIKEQENRSRLDNYCYIKVNAPQNKI